MASNVILSAVEFNDYKKIRAEAIKFMKQEINAHYLKKIELKRKAANGIKQKQRDASNIFEGQLEEVNTQIANLQRSLSKTITRMDCDNMKLTSEEAKIATTDKHTSTKLP